MIVNYIRSYIVIQLYTQDSYKKLGKNKILKILWFILILRLTIIIINIIGLFIFTEDV